MRSATLTGEPASTFNLAPAPLTATPPSIPVGLPSQLLQRRPDIAAAERRVAAANEEIGVARSAYYPSITLSGGGGVESTNLGTLIQGPSALWSIGASASETLFDAGRRRASQQVIELWHSTLAKQEHCTLHAQFAHQDSGEECIAAAKRALQLRPNYADAYNNISAAYNSMAKWDDGIQAALQAIRLNPDYQLAKNNMAWAISQKKAKTSK